MKSNAIQMDIFLSILLCAVYSTYFVTANYQRTTRAKLTLPNLGATEKKPNLFQRRKQLLDQQKTNVCNANCDKDTKCMLNQKNEPICQCTKEETMKTSLDGCCEPFTCGCDYTDCKNFNKDKLNSKLTCKYEILSTDCDGQDLPSELVPFSVRMRLDNNQETEIYVLGVSYKLMPNLRFSVNGMEKSMPYDIDNKIKVTIEQGYLLVFRTSFGLEVTYDGVHKSKYKVSVCKHYANYTCGLCGKIQSPTKFLDKQNKLVSEDAWYKAWTVPDNSPKADKQNCPIEKPTKCEIPLLYRNEEWCGIIKSENSPWLECSNKSGSNLINEQYNECVTELCELEGNPKAQDEALCRRFDQITQICDRKARDLKVIWKYDWSPITNCVMKCSANQEYILTEECPKTCLQKDGIFDCGITKPIESCFCKPGLVENMQGECIKKEECGCEVPGENVMLKVGAEFMAGDCKTVYGCNKLGELAQIKRRVSCHPKATCKEVNVAEYKCVCRDKYKGDGFNCTKT